MTTQAPTKRDSGHVLANGVNYYYEIHGQGEPLLLLHGGLGSIEMFCPGLPVFAQQREVIAVELHGHGRTQLGDHKISLIDQGDDMAAVLKELGRDVVDAMGYSLGAGVAFQLAVQHPSMVRRLVLVSCAFSREGFYPDILEQQAQVSGAGAEFMKGTPMYDTYVAIAPDPDEFPKLLDAMGEYMRRDYDWSEDVKKLEMPVLLAYADNDMFLLEHMIEFYKLLGGGQRDPGWNREHMPQNQLAILPDRTHYDIGVAPELIEAVLPFLNGQSKAPNLG